MPKIVDHRAKQEEIAAAVWRLVSREGIGAATTRNIARELGCSNGIVLHYFADKAELLNAVLLLGYRRVAERIEECVWSTKGLEALREVLALTVALDEQTLLNNKVELAFWGEALANPRLAKEQYVTYELFHRVVRRLLDEARRAGEIAAALDLEVTADALVALIDGIGVQAALTPEAFPPVRQRAILDGVVRMLAAGARSAPSLSRRARKRPAARERGKGGLRKPSSAEARPPR